TIQAAAVLLRTSHGDRMNYMRLIKLLYIADRESIRRFGRTITRDRYVAMDRGPVLSTVLDMIKDRDMLADHWARFIAKDEYDVQLIKSPGHGQLSKSDVDLLHEIAEQYKGKDEWALVEIVHEFPEFLQNPPPPGGSRDIPLAATIAAVGRQDETADI